jgi:hypothetical protein
VYEMYDLVAGLSPSEHEMYDLISGPELSAS